MNFERGNNKGRAWPVNPHQYPLTGPSRGRVYSPPPPPPLTAWAIIGRIVLGAVFIAAFAFAGAVIEYMIPA